MHEARMVPNPGTSKLRNPAMSATQTEVLGTLYIRCSQRNESSYVLGTNFSVMKVFVASIVLLILLLLKLLSLNVDRGDVIGKNFLL